MEKTVKYLRFFYAFFCFHILIVWLVFEFFFDKKIGGGNSDEVVMYFMNIFTLFVTFGCIPLGFKFMSLKKVKEPIISGNENEAGMVYMKFALYRMSIFYAPVFSNFLFYETMQDVSFLYLTGISLLPFLYFFPVRSKIENEFFNLRQVGE